MTYSKDDSMKRFWGFPIQKNVTKNIQQNESEMVWDADESPALPPHWSQGNKGLWKCRERERETDRQWGRGEREADGGRRRQTEPCDWWNRRTSSAIQTFLTQTKREKEAVNVTDSGNKFRSEKTTTDILKNQCLSYHADHAACFCSDDPNAPFLRLWTRVTFFFYSGESWGMLVRQRCGAVRCDMLLTLTDRDEERVDCSVADTSPARHRYSPFEAISSRVELVAS